MLTLTELELDALAETFNLSLGEAAAMFSTIVHEEIELSVPTVEFLNCSELRNRLSQFTRRQSDSTRICGISQQFESENGFSSDTMLLFPEHGSLEIVRRMLGDITPLESITELEQDALAEIGNIIMNSCMSSLSNLFGVSMSGSLPDVCIKNTKDLLNTYNADEMILVAKIGMTLSTNKITGFVLFVMDMPSIQLFMENVKRLFSLPTHIN